MLQAQTHRSMQTANQELAAFNDFSAEEHARLVGRFAQHAATLQAVHTGLMSAFRRTRALRARLLAAHPELAEAAAAADAAREAEIERSREATTSEPPAPSEAPATALPPLASLSVEDSPAAAEVSELRTSEPSE